MNDSYMLCIRKYDARMKRILRITYNGVFKAFRREYHFHIDARPFDIINIVCAIFSFSLYCLVQFLEIMIFGN